jgi:hypothetical protein
MRRAVVPQGESFFPMINSDGCWKLRELVSMNGDDAIYRVTSGFLKRRLLDKKSRRKK